jgi:hypothetical protein
MAEYKFTSMDDFDKAIYDIVESGVFNEAVLISAAQKQSQGVTKSKQEQIIRDTWGLYHGSFDDNETEVMDAIYNITLNNMKATSPSNLDVTVRMLKEFDRAEDAENLLTQYIAERADEKELYDLESILLDQKSETLNFVKRSARNSWNLPMIEILPTFLSQ